MENRYHNRDFEDFVKQNADQYRMFPSEKVWKNINQHIHPKNRWYGIGLVLLLLTTASVTWVMLIPANRNQELADRLPVAATSIRLPGVKSQPLTFTAPAANQPTRPAVSVNAEATPQNLFMADFSGENPETSEPLVANLLAPAAISTIKPTISTNLVVSVPVSAIPATPVMARNVPVRTEINTPPVENNINTVIIASEVTAADETPAPPIAEETSANPQEKTATTDLLTRRDEYPLTIESVVNTYKRNKSKFTLQAYFTPTVSYRRLKEDNQFLSEAQSRTTPSNNMVAVSDVENMVTHKPDYGLLLGVNAGYSLSPRLTLTTGLQFNVNKYDIRAYNYPSETATFALMSGSFSTSSVETETTYRNYSGSKKADWLHNLYFSASLPIGVQFRLSGAGKREIGVGTTLQPTYLLGNRTYLLTTDYKNYAEVPSLIRKWNMSSSFEVYAGYSTGRIDWRIGPQVRYQLISSYRREYPVKEHLFDFGLKLGILLNK